MHSHFFGPDHNLLWILVRLVLTLQTTIFCVPFAASAKEERRLETNEESVLNSVYTESSNQSRLVWAIVQARFSAPSIAGGFCGAAWILEQLDDKLIFVTAGHVVTDQLFSPAEKDIIQTFVWLANGSVTIPLVVSNRIVAKNDISFLVIPISVIPTNELFFPHKIVARGSLNGREIHNLGYPNRENKDNRLRINVNGTRAVVTFSRGPWRQAGHVVTEATVDMFATDVKLEHSKGIVLDYTSEKGFSGGPLLLADQNQLVGMMIAVVPNDGSPPKQSLAVSIEEILEQRRLSLP